MKVMIWNVLRQVNLYLYLNFYSYKHLATNYRQEKPNVSTGDAQNIRIQRSAQNDQQQSINTSASVIQEEENDSSAAR